jgi:hypothetical protein
MLASARQWTRVPLFASLRTGAKSWRAPLIMAATQSSDPAWPRRRINRRLTGTAALIALVVWLLFVHPFLAVDAPVVADTLVIEGWLPQYALDRAVAEIRRGMYDHVMVAGMAQSSARAPDSVWAGQYLEAAGIPPDRIVVIAAPEVRWNRTSSTARAVRDRLRELDVKPNGVNIVTLGPHARQSLLAYSRMLGPSIPMGVINIPKDDYDPAWWWASTAGIKKTTIHFAGWIRELLFGLRS